MFTAGLNLESLRVCAAQGCGKPLPAELPHDAKYCSEECAQREERRRQQSSEAGR